MKTYLTIMFIAYSLYLYGQGKEVNIIDTTKTKIEWEKPLNFFAAAGAAYRFGEQYNVTISTTDYTVQFEQVYPVVTRFSLGMVWNPFPDKRNESVAKYLEGKKAGIAYEAARRHFAVALLINIFRYCSETKDKDINTQR
jgi:hypothetical protein